MIFSSVYRDRNGRSAPKNHRKTAGIIKCGSFFTTQNRDGIAAEILRAQITFLYTLLFSLAFIAGQ